MNSGCIAGKAVDVKNLLLDVRTNNVFFRDDQQFYVRHLVQNPHLISVDVNRELFMTGYKEDPREYYVSYRLGAALNSENRDNIGIIHCNQKEGNSCHARSVIYMRCIYVNCPLIVCFLL